MSDEIKIRNNRNYTAVHVCYLVPGNQSGYETRVIEETKRLGRFGFRIVIACFVNRKQLFPLHTLVRFYLRVKRATGAKIHIIPTLKYFDMHNGPEGVEEVTSSIAKIANRYDADIIHGQALYSVMHALRAKGRTRAKVVFDVHGVTPEETTMSGGHANRVKLLEQWEQEALRSVDLRVFVSRKMKAFFDRKYGFSNLPYTVTPCCVHMSKFEMSHEKRARRRSELGFDGRFVVLYLGTLSVWQWPKAMFALFSQIHRERPDAIFYLLLPHYEHQKAMEALKLHGLPASSYRMEEVPHSEVGNFIGVADVGLLLREASPVNYVSSPTKFGEYLAAGVPVIATSEIGDTSEIIAQNRVGLIVSCSDNGVAPAELNMVLGLMTEVSAGRREYAERCSQTAERLLDWESHGRIFAEAYQQIAQDVR